MASPRKSETSAPRVRLYPYQRAWIADDARFKLSVKSRQIGYTFGTTLRHVRRRLAHKGLTVWLSASLRQSKEAIEYVKTHCSALSEAFDYDEIAFEGVDEKAEQVTLRHNGARIVAMPANPKTARGFAGDVVLDEFAFHQDSIAIWRAAMAIISRGYSLEVVSTPNGQQGKYWDVAKQAGVDPAGVLQQSRWTKGVWSVHWCDVHQAIRDGCPIDAEVMREAAGDEDTWLQEYCCVFLADAENYIPMELIVSAESVDAFITPPENFQPLGELFLGADIGRKKDRTVIWVAEQLGDVLITRRVETLERTPFAKQFEQMDSLMPFVRRACIDATGIGAQLAEDLERKWGTAKVERVEFNLANKEAMATDVKRRFEDRRLRIPGSPAIRRAVNAVKRYTSPTGHFRFDAERTEAGHSDEFWALALCAAASSGTAPAALAAADPVATVREPRGLMSRITAANEHEEEALPVMRRERRSLWQS